MPQPNVIVILADDLGYSDLGCFGGEIRTPALDSLARRGIRLSQFYNTARCSPSRASLLTGMHPHQTGIGVLTRPDLPDGYAGNLSDQCVTIAERLREAGWQTWMSGKWHLASDAASPNSTWPTRRGFERFFGTLAGCGSYYNPQTLTRGEAPVDDASFSEDFYYTDAISDEVVGWIDDYSREDDATPFFAYVAYTAPHWPLHAAEEDIANYDGVFDEGWDALREKRLSRLIDEGIVGPETTLSERDPSQPNWLDAPDKDWQARRMQVYAAQVEVMDRGIGRILDSLDRAGIADDTLVIFLSDNGASAEELPIGEMETFIHKDRVMLEGTRAGDQVRVGNSPDIAPGPEDTYASYGIPWANLSNTPLRKYKRWVHEGGISAPFIASWPAGGLSSGTVIETPFQLVDVVPTILDAAGISNHHAALPPYEDVEFHGRTMLEGWRGTDLAATPLYWEHIGNAAIRDGKWKLVRDHPGKWELYDVESDRTEVQDLAKRHPEIVSSLVDEWHRWADAVGVLSWDDMLANYERRGLAPAAAEE